jgi:hypothetical protein
MHPFTALLVADHLQDLLREAESERRAALVRSVRPHATPRSFALGRLVEAATRRLFRSRSESTTPQRPRPAGA